MPNRIRFTGAREDTGRVGGELACTLVVCPAPTNTLRPCAETSTVPSLVSMRVVPSASTSVRNAVPRTTAVAAGVLISNFESTRVSFWTLAQLRPMV